MSSKPPPPSPHASPPPRDGNKQPNKPRLSPQQIQKLQQEQAKMMNQLNAHFQSYPIHISFPATILSETDDSSTETTKLKTNSDFINLRLLESGVLFDDAQTLGDVSTQLLEFVRDLKSTGCFENVQAFLQPEEQSPPQQQEEEEEEPSSEALPTTLRIHLNEKKWYKLYIGGGIKHQTTNIETNVMTFPKVQFETSLSLLNLGGVTDQTTLSYSIDQTSNPTFVVSHNEPLYNMLGRYNTVLSHWILTTFPTIGSKVNWNWKAMVDTVDWEFGRSYKEFLRGGCWKVENFATLGALPESKHEPYQSITYSITHRDLLPRRHTTLPYACDASPNIISQSGPTLLHSIQYTYLLNNHYTNHKFNPTKGYDYSFQTELATPPGDVGFWKCQSQGSVHVPLGESGHWAMHCCLGGGLLRCLGFGGLCRNGTYVSDRFFVGGPMQLRGFGYGGIGPRAEKGGSSSPGGDSLGGELFYTASLSLSTPIPFFPKYDIHNIPRLFGFINTGTLSGWGVPLHTIVKSSRLSVGGGVAIGTPMGRLEATYSVPLRYGPRDVRRSFQFGFGFSFG